MFFPRFSGSSASDLIAGVVLAAGRSSRMGSPKALLTLRGESFVRRLVRAMVDGGCDPVIVVTGPTEVADSAGIAAEARAAGARVATNPHPESEQIDSLRVALRLLPRDVEAVIATPVDSPGATAELVVELANAIRAGAPIAIPVYAGKRGHPVAFGRAVMPELLAADLPAGARTVIGRHEDAVSLVAVRVSDVLLDVDTPGEYARLRRGAG